MSKAAIPEAILIGVVNIEPGWKSGHGLHVNSFLHKFFEAIKFLAPLFYFGLIQAV